MVRPYDLERFAALAKAQSPHTMFITCADSRVVPDRMLGSNPGEIFVVRNVGNLVPTLDVDAGSSVPAAISFGIAALGVRDIVVCGHSDCGGMKALLGDPVEEFHLRRWLELARPDVAQWRGLGREPEPGPEHDQLSRWCARRQLDHLETYPGVRAARERGDLRLHAWWFDIAAARMMAWSPDAGRYVPARDALSAALRERGEAPHDPAAQPG
ncbi:MAG: Carbonic anhydrase [Myxococcaceae bacterium]|nr:Carbonic anhydrase [Myxococcaceae bacterium]